LDCQRISRLISPIGGVTFGRLSKVEIYLLKQHWVLIFELFRISRTMTKGLLFIPHHPTIRCFFSFIRCPFFSKFSFSCSLPANQFFFLRKRCSSLRQTLSLSTSCLRFQSRPAFSVSISSLFFFGIFLMPRATARQRIIVVTQQ